MYEDKIKSLIDSASKNYKNNGLNIFNSEYEKYARVLERVEEAKEELNNIVLEIEEIWKQIKRGANDFIIDTEYEIVKRKTADCIQDLAETSALMSYKILK